uniref:Rho GTPase-activating protein 12 n=1 Tax=Xenopus tropicalis TaxID=8364 RepID=A0A803KAZ8_XENTR
MADKSGKPVPGPVYIEVEYDYEYEYKNKKIVIKQGEKYILVKKSNEDWWQVKKDENAKPLYVPAQYVKEVGRKALMPPVKQQTLLPNSPLKVAHRSTENINKSPELSSFGKTSSFRDANQNMGPSSSPGPTRALTLDLVHNNGKLNCDLHSPKGTSRSPSATHFPGPELMEVEKASLSNEHSGDSAGDSSEKILLDSESGDELSSSSTEQLQLSADDIYHSTCDNQSDSQYGSPPRGWSEELDQHGHTTFINDQTNEKWIKHVDDQGRPYYYSADGSRSEWELPKYNATLQPLREITKSRSLDRKLQDPIVFTKWRHSTILLDTNDKDSSATSKPDETSPPSPKQQVTDQEKYGVLLVTKITENGKKVRKNWMSSWTVLKGTTLLLQANAAGWKFGGNQSKPEFTVDIKGASVDWASKDKSSKKNVIELKTTSGTELLIQSDSDTVIKDWYTAFCNTTGTTPGDLEEACEDNVPESPVDKHGKEKFDKEKDHDRDSKKNRSFKPANSIDNAEQKKTKTKLKKFLTRRPTMQAVREKGYIKDPVFGSSLASLCQRENTTVPNFVKMCIEHVEEQGLDVDGLYRVSGNLAVIQKLRFAVTHDEKLDLNDSKWEDIHVITGALKMFFRELPEPLFTFSHFNDFVNAIKQEPKLRVQAIKDLIKQLPKPNHDTMQALFKHLKKVVETGEKNRMTYQSLAIVFGPTLLKPESETGNIAIHTVYQNQIVELILLECNSIFGR